MDQPRVEQTFSIGVIKFAPMGEVIKIKITLGLLLLLNSTLGQFSSSDNVGSNIRVIRLPSSRAESLKREIFLFKN